MKEAASWEDTPVRDGEGERGRSNEERRTEVVGCGERKSGGLLARGGGEGASPTRESLEERSVVTIAGMLLLEDMSGTGEGEAGEGSQRDI